jgi:hypothetical protein
MTELGGMTHSALAVDRVLVSATHATPLDEARLDQLRPDPLNGPFRNADALGDRSARGQPITSRLMTEDQIQEVVDRVADLTRHYLAHARDEWPGESFEVKTLGVVLELDFEDGIVVGYNCSDPRPWAQAGFFRRAMRGADTEEVQP